MTRQRIRRKLNFNQLYNVISFSFFMFIFLLFCLLESSLPAEGSFRKPDSFFAYWVKKKTKRRSCSQLGAIHSTKIHTGPRGKSGPPQKVDQFFRNFSGWTEPIH